MKGMPSLAASSMTMARLIPGSVLTVVGDTIAPFSTIKKLAPLVSVTLPSGIQEQRHRLGIDQPGFLIGQVKVHPAAILHLRIVALRRHMPDRRRDDAPVCIFLAHSSNGIGKV